MEGYQTSKNFKIRTSYRAIKQILSQGTRRNSEGDTSFSRKNIPILTTNDDHINASVLEQIQTNRKSYQKYLQISNKLSDSSKLYSKILKTKIKTFDRNKIKITAKNNNNLQIIKKNNKIMLNTLSKPQDNHIKRKKVSFSQIKNPIIDITQEPTICLDGHFSLSRTGAVAVSYQGKAYILGGQTSYNIIPLHYLENTVWKKLKSTNDPNISLTYHTGQISRNLAIWIGGYNCFSDIQYNNQIFITNLQTSQWYKLYWGVYIKHHASTSFGNLVIISGGITPNNQRLGSFYFLTIDYNNMLNSKIQQFQPHSNIVKLSHHKICNTYEIDSLIRSKVQIQGLISFGGLVGNDVVSSDIYYLKLCLRGRDSIYERQDKKQINWQKMEILGIKPKGRYNHTFNLIPKKAICVLFGGTDSNKQVLNDLWLFDLSKLNWMQINHNYRFLSRGLSNHCATCCNEVLMIMGGYDEKGMYNGELIKIDFLRKQRKGIQLKQRDQIQTFLQLTSRNIL